MSVRYYYGDVDGNFVELTDRIQTQNLRVTTSAEQGGVGSSSIVIDDPDGDLEIVGLRPFYLDDDEAPDENVRLWVGYISDRNFTRMNPEVERSRKIEVTLHDLNSLLSRRVMVGSDCNRPEETDVERVTWLLSTTEASFITDPANTYFSTASPVNMDAVDYRGQYLFDILYDCGQQSGKNFYLLMVFADYNDYDVSLWYDFASSDEYPSAIRISNVLGDVDDVVTFAAGEESRLTRSPSRVFSGVYMPFDGGAVYRQNNDTAAAFARRDTVAPQVNVKTATKARTRADRYLADISTEEDTITTHIIVPNAQVNDVMAGMLIPGRFSHFYPEGYATDFVDMRVLNRTVSVFTPGFYRVELTLSPLEPPPPPSPSILIAVFHMSDVSAEPADASVNPWTKAFWTGDYRYASQFPGPGGHSAMGMWYREVVAGESATVLQIVQGGSNSMGCWVYQVEGVTLTGIQETHGVDLYNDTGGSVSSPSAGSPSTFFGGFMLQKVNYGQFTILNGPLSTIVTDTNGFNQTGICGDGDANPPKAWVGYGSGTGVITIGMTGWDCTGATPNYNDFGRGYGGLLMENTGTFAITQQAFDFATGADVVVTLPAPP